jgi:oligopeptide transport system ATP-binding protein
MYAGYVVESGPTEALFADPRHPYTLGLLRSIPRIDEPRKEMLVPIEGLPPDLIAPPPGCPFRPRCPYAVERCVPDNPSLEPVLRGHSIACWVDVNGARA